MLKFIWANKHQLERKSNVCKQGSSSAPYAQFAPFSTIDSHKDGSNSLEGRTMLLGGSSLAVHGLGELEALSSESP